jgi:hypothetical protein
MLDGDQDRDLDRAMVLPVRALDPVRFTRRARER